MHDRAGATLNKLWSAAAAAQADYETLRRAGFPLVGVAAQRLAPRGLAGLITWPAAEPVFDATLIGADRPAWIPHSDPRIEALASAYALLLTTDTTQAVTTMRNVH